MTKISIVTAVYNRAKTIQETIDSVSSQQGCDYEYVVIDGNSNDGTGQIIAENSSGIDISIRESDNGIYDALNKGIQAATGDVVGFLHADDLFASSHVIQKVGEMLDSGEYDAIYGDLVYVDAADPCRVIRYWKSKPYRVQKFRSGWMPPHPTVYIRKSVYEAFGMYRTDMGTGADYECMVRHMVVNKIRVGYVPEVMVKMRVGGASNASLSSRIKANLGDRDAWISNGLTAPLGIRWTKPLSKLFQYFRKPPS